MELTEKESIERKLESLQRMAQCCSEEPEGQNAKRIIESIIKKYNLNPEEYSLERKKITFKVHRLKRYAMQLSLFCKIPCYCIHGTPGNIVITADSLEYKMFYELLDEIKFQFNKKERELLQESKIRFSTYGEDACLRWKNDALKSFMAGYMKANFPFDHNLCTICKKGKIQKISEDKAVCDNPDCRATYRLGKSSFRTHGSNSEMFNMGMNTNVKSLRQNKVEIGFNS